MSMTDLPPSNATAGRLVKSVFRGEDGHEEEAFHRAADPGVSEGGRGLDDPPSIMQRCALPASSLQIYGPE